MSGGGRCNITHGGSVKDFISCYGEAGPRLRKCLYRHSNIDLASWLEENGMPLADSRGEPVYSWDLTDAGRVFPASHKASDILNLLLEKTKSNGWEIRTDTEVHGICQCEGGWSVSASPSAELTAENVVIASGGITFPETGSDGSVLRILSDLGINVTQLKSALAPVYVKDYPYEELSGISIPNVTVTAFSSDAVNTCKGKAARMTGDLLFTHRGFSGPVILNISKYAEPGELIRIKYNKEFDELPKRMQRALEARAKGPSGDVRTTRLTAILDSDDFTVGSIDPNGMVTTGGISLDSIDTSDMQISGMPGLYAIGEAIDADGITGGYNLQMCWSTAQTAAESLAKVL
jgi:predicted Rossmann fold flavoprotein